MLPYREIDQSGVLFTALAFGKPLLLSDVGGFPEVAATGAARTFPAGDARALHDALRELLADPARARRSWQSAPARPPPAPYSWERDRPPHARALRAAPQRESPPMRLALEIVFWLCCAR